MSSTNSEKTSEEKLRKCTAVPLSLPDHGHNARSHEALACDRAPSRAERQRLGSGGPAAPQESMGTAAVLQGTQGAGGRGRGGLTSPLCWPQRWSGRARQPRQQQPGGRRHRAQARRNSAPLGRAQPQGTGTLRFAAGAEDAKLRGEPPGGSHSTHPWGQEAAADCGGSRGLGQTPCLQPEVVSAAGSVVSATGSVLRILPHLEQHRSAKPGLCQGWAALTEGHLATGTGTNKQPS